MTDSVINEEMRVKRRRATVALLVVLGLGGLLVSVYMLTLGRHALAGDDVHDFGVLLVPQPDSHPMIARQVHDGRPVEAYEVTADHTFTLTNRSRRAVHIGNITATCGCIQPRSWHPEVVEPGEEFSLDVRIALRNNGFSDERVTIETTDAHGAPMGVRTLRVRGAGREQRQLHTTRDQLLLIGDRSETITVRISVWPDDPLGDDGRPELMIDADEILDVSLLRLNQDTTADMRRHVPATWTAQLQVRAVDDLDWSAYEHERTSATIRFLYEPAPAIAFPVRLMRTAPAVDLPGTGEPQTDEPFNPLQFEPGTDGDPLQADR